MTPLLSLIVTANYLFILQLPPAHGRTTSTESEQRRTKATPGSQRAGSQPVLGTLYQLRVCSVPVSNIGSAFPSSSPSVH
jgi:hypothetical protein